MANYTANFKLKKPLGTENFNIEDQNGNMDLIDIKLKEISDGSLIADGSIAKTKLNSSIQTELNKITTLESSLAEKATKDGTVQTNLNAEKISGKTASIAPLTTNKTDIIGMVNELFTNANDGKTAVANAVTAKGVSASPTDTFSALATKIGQISTGKKYAQGTATSNDTTVTHWSGTHYLLTVTGLQFKPSIIILGNNITAYITMYYQDGFFSSAFNKTFNVLLGTPNGGNMDVLNTMTNTKVDGTGFVLPVNGSNLLYNWIAIE